MYFFFTSLNVFGLITDELSLSECDEKKENTHHVEQVKGNKIQHNTMQSGVWNGRFGHRGNSIYEMKMKMVYDNLCSITTP